MQRQQQQQFRENLPYVSHSADLVPSLDGQEGTFEVIFGTQAFNAKVEDIQGHSPVLTSLIPAGQKHVWVITKLEAQQAGTLDEQNQNQDTRSRAAVGSSR